MKYLAFLSLCGLAACAEGRAPLSEDFGNSVSANIAAQVVNPGPNMGDQYPTTDGRRSNDALERYRTGHVYPPIPPIEAAVKQGTAPTEPQPMPGVGQ
jgi:type IV pilus biogenesis protein CpaD/CtpE